MSPASDLAFAVAEQYTPERRSNVRYEIALKVSYQLHPNGPFGHGQTLNFSSRGILFAADRSLPCGEIILAITWPFSLDQTPLQLVVRGSIVRSDARGTAVKIVRKEFRTRRGSGWWVGGSTKPNGSCAW